MPSKWRGCLKVIALGLFLFGTSCGLKIGEKPAENKEIDLGDQVGCLDGAGVQISKYFHGELSHGQVEEFFSCLRFSIATFERYTVGKKEQSYEPEEIVNFLHYHFLKDQKISKEFLTEIKHIKVLFLGGGLDVITRQELIEFNDLLKSWEKTLLKLNPFISIINWPVTGGNKGVTWSRLEGGIEALSEAMKALAEPLKKSDYKYDFNRVDTLIDEMRLFLKWEVIRPGSLWGSLLRSLTFLLNPSETTVVSGAELPERLQRLVEAYGLYSQFQYFIVRKFHGEDGNRLNHLQSGKGLAHLGTWMKNVVKVGMKTSERWKDNEIKIVKLYPLIDVASQFHGLPFGVGASALKNALPILFGKVFGDLRKAPEKRISDGLHKLQWVRMHNEFKRWFEFQNLLDLKYNGAIRLGEDPNAEIQDFDRQDITLWNAVQFHEIGELRRLEKNITPLFYNGATNVTLADQGTKRRMGLKHDFKGLSLVNIYRSLMSLAIRGYSNGKNVLWNLDEGLTDHEFESLYLDAKELGVDLGFMDPRIQRVGYRSFTEANLFTVVATGAPMSTEGKRTLDKLMTAEEGMVFLAYLKSAGNIANSIYGKLKVLCKHGELDFRNEPYLDRNCVKENFLEPLTEAIKSLPQQRAYLLALQAERQRIYIERLFKSAFSSLSKKDWVEKGEISTIAVVLQYSETVFSRFDADENQLLEEKEVEEAFPIFRNFIRKMAMAVCFGDPEGRWLINTEDIYRHILDTAQVPTAKNLAAMKKRRWWDWDPHYDRGHLTRVFASIIAKMSNPGPKKVCK